jgi:integrase
MFLYDTGIRAPTELMNIKVSDFYCDFKELNIRDEISKTFGRRIKLMLSSDLIKEYIKEKKLGNEDYLFKIMPWNANRYLRELGKRVLGDEMSQAGQKYSELSMYDFRHCSCCYWLPRYKSESALKYRFGWKGSDKIHYYSELLGMRDTISQDDLLLDNTKTELEKELIKTKNEKEMMQEQINLLQEQFSQVSSMMKQLKVFNVNL